MPVMARRSLGATYPGPVPVYDYYGRKVDPSTPATDADCLPFRCGAQTTNTNAHFWCAYWGRAGNFSGCTDARCVPFRPSYCVPGAGGPALAPQPKVTANVPTGGQLPSSGGGAPAGGSGGGGDNGGGTTVVQTPTGPIVVPASVVPSASGPLTPAMIHIPNVWDSLDPSRMSQFEYRGLSLSLPFWISSAFRDSLAPKPAPVADVAALDISSVPGWVWLLILAALLLMGHKRAKHRSAKHGAK